MLLWCELSGFRIPRSSDRLSSFVPRQAEVLAGSPQSILCGLHQASGEDSPNGVASQFSSPPSSPLEQPPADPWDLLNEAAGQVARLRTNSIPVPTNAAAHPGHHVVPPAKKPSAPTEIPKAPVANHAQPNNSVEQRRIQIARVSTTSAIDCGHAQAFPLCLIRGPPRFRF